MSHAEDAFTARLNRVIENAGGAAEVAKLAGCTSQAVYGWMAGSRPLQSRLVKLCGALGISFRWLDTGEGEEPRAVTHATSKPHTMNEDTVGTKENGTLAHTLAELILGFDDLPPAYEAMALKQIREHFAEFERRATMRSEVRHPSPRPLYEKKPHTKRKP